MRHSSQLTFFVWPTVAITYLVNFLVFVAVWLFIGGSALWVPMPPHGFVVSTSGTLSEVGHGVWVYSIYHTALTISYFPLGVVAAFMTWVNHKWPVIKPVWPGLRSGSDDPYGKSGET